LELLFVPMLVVPYKPIDKIIVGCGVVWLLAWLMTYGGADCRLWSFVYNKCMEAEPCSELAKILTDELKKHRCFGYAPK